MHYPYKYTKLLENITVHRLCYIKTASHGSLEGHYWDYSCTHVYVLVIKILFCYFLINFLYSKEDDRNREQGDMFTYTYYKEMNVCKFVMITTTYWYLKIICDCRGFCYYIPRVEVHGSCIICAWIILFIWNSSRKAKAMKLRYHTCINENYHNIIKHKKNMKCSKQ